MDLGNGYTLHEELARSEPKSKAVQRHEGRQVSASRRTRGGPCLMVSKTY